MEGYTYRALVVEETAQHTFTREVKECSADTLPPGEVTVRVKYSSLNYKDALSATGNKGVTRKYPHTPGIDGAGIVEESTSQGFKQGDSVIVTSYDLGMNTPGGFGQYIRVPAAWVLHLPLGLTLKESMIFGTAGLTAGMSVYKLADTVKPDHGDILVTGVTGGVGSIAAAILAKLGYNVVGVSGKHDADAFLMNLGVRDIISREDVTMHSERPMLKTRWAGVVDTVGGEILAAAIKATHPLGVITCCGNVASADLPLNVFPFILRGVMLIGIDSQNCPMKLREKVWGRLAGEWKIDKLADLHKEIPLEALSEHVDLILNGQLRGRTVVAMDA